MSASPRATGSASLAIHAAPARRTVYSLSVSAELAARLSAHGASPRIALVLGTDGKATEKTAAAAVRLVVDGETYTLSQRRESQPVDVASLARDGTGLEIVGTVCERLAVKQELAQAKMAEIRQQSEDAERVRLARKTVALEDHPRTTKSRSVAKPGASTAARTTKTTTTATATTTGTRIGGMPRTPSSSSSSLAAAARAVSERDSQLSWSPVLTEHASATPFSLDALLDRPAPLSKQLAASPHTDRKPATSSLIPSRPAASAAGAAALLSTTTDARNNTYHQMVEEFGHRYREYLRLNKWMDERLAVFGLLQQDLAAAPPSSRTEEQLIFRIVIEERRLRDDQEYQTKMELLEECCAALMMIKARLAALVKSS